MYYIYENWQAGPHKTVMHVASCGFCKDGQGLSGGSDPKHGRWHGPFESLVNAEKFQSHMRVEAMLSCRCVKT